MGRDGITEKSETNTVFDHLQGYTQSQPSLRPAETFTVVCRIVETRFYHGAQADQTPNPTASAP